MKRLTINFQARNKFTGLTILKLLKTGFKRAVKVRNKKEKNARGEFIYTAGLPPLHYGELKVIITGTNKAIDDEEQYLIKSLYKLLSEYKDDKQLNEAISRFKLMKDKSINWTKDKLSMLYLTLGVAVSWKKEELKGEFTK